MKGNSSFPMDLTGRFRSPIWAATVSVLLLTTGIPCRAQDKLLNKYTTTRSEGGLTSRESNSSDAAAPPDGRGTARLTRREFEEVIDGNYKFSYRKVRPGTVGTADFIFMLMVHPRMQFYLPAAGRFVKGFAQGADPGLVRKKVAETLKGIGREPLSPETVKLNKDIGVLEKSLAELLPSRNREYANAANKFSFTGSDGSALPETEMAKVTSDYQAALSAIDRSFDSRRREISIAIEKKRRELQELEAERLSSVYTTPVETSRWISEMMSELKDLAEDYCKKTGIEAVFDSSFGLVTPGTAFAANRNAGSGGLGISPADSGAYPGPDPSLATEYMDFLARPDIMRVDDSGLVTARLEDLRGWFEKQPRLSELFGTLRKRPFLLAGGQDITREIVYLLLKKHGLPNEKIQLIIHYYEENRE